MNPKTDPAAHETAGKPRVSYLIATAFGLGYLPLAPGTWGSLGGVAVYCVMLFPYFSAGKDVLISPGGYLKVLLLRPWLLPLLVLVIAAVGVWSADLVSRDVGQRDPGIVVIDEVFGQLITYVFGLATANWKYLLLGFILFRVLDIWKPFPARQAESLPGGWGIMADDSIAGIYAAVGLWLARAAGM